MLLENLGRAPETGPRHQVMVLTAPRQPDLFRIGQLFSADWRRPLPQHFEDGVFGLAAHASRMMLAAAGIEPIETFLQIDVPVQRAGVKLLKRARKQAFAQRENSRIRLFRSLVQPVGRHGKILEIPHPARRKRFPEHAAQHLLLPRLRLLQHLIHLLRHRRCGGGDTGKKTQYHHSIFFHSFPYSVSIL